MNYFLLALLITGCLEVFGEKARYDNYRVYSADILNQNQLNILKELETYSDGIRFIDAPIAVHQNIDILVPPHKFPHIGQLFETHNINHRIKIKNLQNLIDMEQPKVLRSGLSWTQYNDLSTIYKWLDELLEQYPKLLKSYNYGKSYEGRPLRAVKLSSKSGNPVIFIESTIHAREWITAATVTYFLNELLASNDTKIRNLAENYDWVIVPVTNVDGYEYTHTKDRMWRKNRTPSGQCYGADLNRNFDFHHLGPGSSNQPCSETFAGLKPFSEPESLALSKFIATFDNMKLYISFHSYSQLLMFPFGHTNEHAPNHQDLLRIGQKSIDAIKKRYGTDYRTGNIAETIYLASGSSIDWVYGKLNVSLTYTFEFRDKGRYGFILPANQIIPNSLEIVDGLKAMIDEAKKLRYF